MKVLLLFAVCLPVNICMAQHIGIGTTTPLSTLDVRGNFRVGGLSNYMTYDSVAGRIEWRNSRLYVPVSQSIMHHSAAADGLYYNNTNPDSGQLEYRNAAGNPVFFTNFTNGRGYFSGDVGIGTTTPGARLHVRYGASGYNGPGYFLGAAVEGDNNTYLNLLTPVSKESGLLFGNPDNLAHGGIVYNNSSTSNGLQFRTGGNDTKMIITANGKVGIGTTGPAYKLHVNEGSIRAEGWNSSAATISMSSVGKFEVDAPFLAGGRFVIQENGNIGIGSVAPSQKLEVAGNIKAASYQFATLKTFYYSIPALDFQPRFSSDPLFKNYAEAFYNGTSSNYGELSAAVHLPQGANVTGFTAYYHDLASPADLRIDLLYKSHGEFSGSTNVLASVRSSGVPGNTSSSAIITVSNTVINNAGNYYFVRANSVDGAALIPWPPAMLIVRSIVIRYTLSEAQ